MEVNVAYACNDAYMIHTGISLISLFENNQDIDQITVFFIDMGISKESRGALQSIVDKYERKLVIIPFIDWELELPVNSTGRHIKSVYAKIFFGRIQGINKILYIDSDTVVVSSIKELWNIDMRNYAIAGVQTINTPAVKKKIGLKQDDFVMNDGVALLNLNMWRKMGFEKKCIDYIEKWNGLPPVLSEGTINAICQKYMYKLDVRYNLTSACTDYSSKELRLVAGTEYYNEQGIEEAIKKPCIIHYVSGFHERPWCENSTHPFKDEYLKYKQLSQWVDTPLEESKLSIRTKFVAAIHRALPTCAFVFLYKLWGRANKFD